MANTTVLPLRMEVKFRNNIILRMMEGLEIKTVADLCRQANLQQQQVGELINMKELPLNKKGEWRLAVIQLAEFFHCMPEDMFSKEQLRTRLEKNRNFAEFTFEQVRTLIAGHEAERLLPEKVAEDSEFKRLTTEILGTLRLEEEKVVRLRFGIETDEHTLDQVAGLFGLSRERIRQIEDKALRKLRNSPNSNYLRQFLDSDEDVDNGNYNARHQRYGAR